MDYPPRYDFDPAYSRPLEMPPMAGRPYQLPGSDNGYGMPVYTPAGQYTAINLMRGNTHSFPPPPPPAWHPPLAYTGANTNVPRPWEY